MFHEPQKFDPLLTAKFHLSPISLLFLSVSLPLFAVITHTESLDLTDIDVPQIVDVKDTVTLLCNYSMGRDKLHSVKWYKDGQEFYR